MTTLGRTEHAVFDYPAAATALNADDISSLGTNSLGETFRGVPGMQVARMDSFDYAISIRGFNDNTANQLLVISDGRSLRDSTFSGTSWGLQNLIMADLERIDILRGPGAALWGANSMNGFINIVSKSAHETLGDYFSVELGNNRNNTLETRHGWMWDKTTAARLYLKTQEDNSFFPDVSPEVKNWRNWLLGTRVDRRLKTNGRLSVIAEWRHLELDGETFAPSLTPPYESFFRIHVELIP
ncbi:MAG: Plug domain-containing protein [Candidatus Synoicihabitans palmerolidicus]|nr:Plug domain-containing protein [Candidatus Synoicihabitans palmerolidicus]